MGVGKDSLRARTRGRRKRAHGRRGPDRHPSGRATAPARACAALRLSSAPSSAQAELLEKPCAGRARCHGL